MLKNSKAFGNLLKILCLTMVFAIIFVGTALAQEKPITVKVDGEAVEFDAQPTVVEGEVMVPVRKLFEKMGSEVLWDPFFERVLINIADDDSIQMYIGYGEIFRNGIEVKTARTPFISEGRTYVSLDFINKITGQSVEYSGASRAVYIVPEHKAMQYIPFGEYLSIPAPVSVNRNYKVLDYDNTTEVMVTTFDLNGENEADFERYALIMEATGFKTVKMADENDATDVYFGKSGLVTGMVVKLERPDEKGQFKVYVCSDPEGETIKEYLESEAE